MYASKQTHTHTHTHTHTYTHTHTHTSIHPPYFGSSVSSAEKDIDTRLTKAWSSIDKLSIIWKSDLTDKMKHSFFQAADMSILLYGCTTWTLKKRMLKKLDGNYSRMLRAILNKSWQQHLYKVPNKSHETYPN